MRSAWRFAGALLAAGLICASAATAKDFEPGDLRLCNAGRCIPIRDRGLLLAFSSFYYGEGRPAVVRPPRRGARAFELRFRNGYVSGLVGGGRLDRMLVYGVNCGRFRRGKWYRLPARTVRQLSRLAIPLAPLHVTGSVPRSC